MWIHPGGQGQSAEELNSDRCSIWLLFALVKVFCIDCIAIFSCPAQLILLCSVLPTSHWANAALTFVGASSNQVQ